MPGLVLLGAELDHWVLWHDWVPSPGPYASALDTTSKFSWAGAVVPSPFGPLFSEKTLVHASQDRDNRYP
jgi:hypothetical protein